jgi:hypothetical protein
MLYAILCYDCEAALETWCRREEQAALARLAGIERPLRAAGRLGPALRFLPTTTATTLRKDRAADVTDGPFAATGEDLVGCYIVDCPSLDAAIAVAGDFARAVDRGTCALEIRPLSGYSPGMLPA